MQYRDFDKVNVMVPHQAGATAMNFMRLLFARKNYGNGVISRNVCPVVKNTIVVPCKGP